MFCHHRSQKRFQNFKDTFPPALIVVNKKHCFRFPLNKQVWRSTTRWVCSRLCSFSQPWQPGTFILWERGSSGVRSQLRAFTKTLARLNPSQLSTTCRSSSSSTGELAARLHANWRHHWNGNLAAVRYLIVWILRRFYFLFSTYLSPPISPLLFISLCSLFQ